MTKGLIEAVYTYVHQLVTAEITKHIIVAGGTPAMENTGPEFREPWIPRIGTQTKSLEMVFKLRNFTSLGLQNYRS